MRKTWREGAQGTHFKKAAHRDGREGTVARAGTARHTASRVRKPRVDSVLCPLSPLRSMI